MIKQDISPSFLSQRLRINKCEVVRIAGRERFPQGRTVEKAGGLDAVLRAQAEWQELRATVLRIMATKRFTTIRELVHEFPLNGGSERYIRRLVRGLEREGLVERSALPKFIRLTERGRREARLLG